MGFLSFLPVVYQGAIIMAAGIVLLLHTLGLFEKGLQYLIIAGAIYMIIHGFIKMDGFAKLQNLFTRKSDKK